MTSDVLFRTIDKEKELCYNIIKFVSKGEQNMSFHLTDQRKKKISSVQSIPMKHCAEYSI